MNSKSKDTFTGGEIIESDDVWIINSIDWNGTGFRYGIFFEKGFGCIVNGHRAELMTINELVPVDYR